VFVRWTIAPTVAGVPEVRHRLRELLRGWGVSEDVEDTLLLVATELTSNAVRHAAVRTERIRVTAAHSGCEVRLEVTDDHPFRPRALLETGLESEDGRGLMIVKLMVAELGGHIDVLSHDPGKTIRVSVCAFPDERARLT
jgi:two-component sensor histidine kinase